METTGAETAGVRITDLWLSTGKHVVCSAEQVFKDGSFFNYHYLKEQFDILSRVKHDDSCPRGDYEDDKPVGSHCSKPRNSPALKLIS